MQFFYYFFFFVGIVPFSLWMLLVIISTTEALSCRDPMADKDVDRWFMLTSPLLKTGDKEILFKTIGVEPEPKKFGFLWSTADLDKASLCLDK